MTPSFETILEEELNKQLPEGYPATISKEFIVKDVVDIVKFSMRTWVSMTVDEMADEVLVNETEDGDK